MKACFQIAECSLSFAKIPNKLHSAKSSALSSNRRNLYHPQKSLGILPQSPYIAFILKSVIRSFFRLSCPHAGQRLTTNRDSFQFMTASPLSRTFSDKNNPPVQHIFLPTQIEKHQLRANNVQFAYNNEKCIY